MQTDLTKNYTITVWQEEWGKSKVWLARCECGNQTFITQGRTEAELWRMVADAFLTMRGVRLPWWKRLIYRIVK